MAPLDPGIELTAYRIVQEALTNARRHATGAAVDVELEYRPDALVVRVRDNGPGPGTAPTASGTASPACSERVAMVGGDALRPEPDRAAGSSSGPTCRSAVTS